MPAAGPRQTNGKPPAEPLQLDDPKAGSAGKSFDPYNSGAFKHRDAWEKVTRK